MTPGNPPEPAGSLAGLNRVCISASAAVVKLRFENPTWHNGFRLGVDALGPDWRQLVRSAYRLLVALVST